MEVRPFNFRSLSQRAKTGVVSSSAMSGNSAQTSYDKNEKNFGYDEGEISKRINEAEKRGYQKGLEAGKAEATSKNAEIEKKLTTIFSSMDAKINNFFNSQLEISSKALNDAINLAVKVARKIAGDALKENPQAAIEAMIKKSIGFIVNEPQLIVVVNDKMAAEMEERINKIVKSKGFEGKILVRGNADLAEGDCILEWESGSARLESSELWKKVDSVIESSGVNLPPAKQESQQKPSIRNVNTGSDDKQGG